MAADHPPNIEPFISRWEASGAAERANYALFLTQLCDLLALPQPDPTHTEDEENAYVFERNVHFHEDDGTTSIGRIDLYKRGAFVLEAKQGSDAQSEEEQAEEVLQPKRAKKTRRRGTAVRGTKAWDDAMVRARGQAGEELTAKEKIIHEQGLVSVLRQIHDDLDAAVFEAYGWPTTLSDEEILERLVALNAQRAAEEAGGLIRWLRPEFQNPAGTSAQQTALVLTHDEQDAETEQPAGKSDKKKSAAPESKTGKAKPTDKRPWPKGREAQAKAVLAALRKRNVAVTPDQLAQRFSRAHRETLDELLQALVTLGQARRLRGNKFSRV